MTPRLISFIQESCRSRAASTFWWCPFLSLLFCFVLSTFNRTQTAPSSLWIRSTRLRLCRCLMNMNSRKSAIALSFSSQTCTAPTIWSTVCFFKNSQPLIHLISPQSLLMMLWFPYVFRQTFRIYASSFFSVNSVGFRMESSVLLSVKIN